MTTREMLECRIYLAEDAMYRRSDELNGHLHELEARLKDLTEAVHRTLCQSGRTPLDVKSSSIVQAVEAFEMGIDLSEIRSEAERVTSLKGLIEGYERDIAEGAGVSGAGSAGRPVLEVLAAAS
jgi:hypothetical protein